jgi:hypothetical protein
MPQSCFRPVVSLLAVTIWLPLAFGQNPAVSGNGDVFSSRTKNNNDCMDVYKQTAQKINEESLRMQAQARQDQAACMIDQGCVHAVQLRRVAAERADNEKLRIAQEQLNACEMKPGDTNSGGGGAVAPSNTGTTALQGYAEGNLRPDPASNPYKTGTSNDASAKKLPKMTGFVVYGRADRSQPPSRRSQQQGVDPFIAGLRDGSRECAIGAETIVHAAQASMSLDFVLAQRLLGIDRSDIASQFLHGLVNDLQAPVAGQSPYASGFRIAKRVCTYGLLWSGRSPRSTLQGIPAPPSTFKMIRESAGADVWTGEYHVDPFTGERFRIMGRSRTPKSHATATYANKGESLAYQEALNRGEIGLQRPAGANVPGADFITAITDRTRVREVVITDVKASLRGRFPVPKATIPGNWHAELLDAVSTDRLSLSDPVIEEAVREAVTNGRIRLRQLNVDFSSSGPGMIKGF